MTLDMVMKKSLRYIMMMDTEDNEHYLTRIITKIFKGTDKERYINFNTDVTY